MAADDVITKARELPSGAVFHRCALQVNPHHYDSTYPGNARSGDAVDHAGAIVQKASDLGVSVLAITDHNHVGGVAAFRAAAEGRGIHIFPGFELSSSEGIHVLCIYAPDTADGLLARYLGGFGITDTKPSAKLADKAFVDILAKVHEQGGVAIAAHVTNNSGLLKVLTGQACIRAWRSSDLLAIQIPGSVANLPLDAKQIVENTNHDYRRDPAAEDGLAIAVVNAKDIAKPEDLDDRSATCWIKMSEVTIEIAVADRAVFQVDQAASESEALRGPVEERRHDAAVGGDVHVSAVGVPEVRHAVALEPSPDAAGAPAQHV